jgi:hypothetical protein
MFFFEKKNQKTFAYLCLARRQRTPWSRFFGLRRGTGRIFVPQGEQ